MSTPLRILMAAAECVPFVKVGGLGDVLGALPVALEQLGHSVTVVLPRYQVIDLHKWGFQPICVAGAARVPVGFESIPYEVHYGTLPESSVDVFLVGNDRFFGRSGIYLDNATGHDYADQADRWIFFQRAVMDFFNNTSAPIDVLHCHDHQTGLLPAYLRRFYRATPRAFAATRSMFTIHNLGYQGLFGREVLLRAGFSEADFRPAGPFEFYGMTNFMKAGITHADLITTVSPTYAVEIQHNSEFGYGLEGVLRERHNDLIGILNGIDDQLWNPAKDPLIPVKYTKTNLAGKQEDKKALLQKFELDSSNLEWPVLAMISRIEAQKGFDLLLSVLDDLLNGDLYFVLLGSGNKEIVTHLHAIAARHRGKAGIRIEFDNAVAHLVEAGADIFLMPSRYEPCGLNQMYSLRYGTVPVVRQTGGLADTVKEYDPLTGEGDGFVFKGYDAGDLRAAIDRALRVWQYKTRWRQIVKNGMGLDLSWKQSALQYAEAYERLRNLKF